MDKELEAIVNQVEQEAGKRDDPEYFVKKLIARLKVQIDHKSWREG